MPKPRTAPKPKAKPRVQRAKAPVAPAKTPLKVKVVSAGPQRPSSRRLRVACSATPRFRRASVARGIGCSRSNPSSRRRVRAAVGSRRRSRSPTGRRSTTTRRTRRSSSTPRSTAAGARRSSNPASSLRRRETNSTRPCGCSRRIPISALSFATSGCVRTRRCRPWSKPKAIRLGPSVRSRSAFSQPKRADPRVVGVNLVRRTVVRFKENASDTAMAHDTICGIPYTQQDTTGRTYVPGQVVVTVSQGGTVLWKFVAIRRRPRRVPAARRTAPASSSGPSATAARSSSTARTCRSSMSSTTRAAAAPTGTGRTRKGRSTRRAPTSRRLPPLPAAREDDPRHGLGRRQLPRRGDLCQGAGGGARQRDGGRLVSVHQRVAVPRGRHDPTALHVHRRPELVRLQRAPPPCLLAVHFDLRTPGNNVVKEFNDPPLPGFGTAKWHTKDFEIQRPRAPKRKRKWWVENSVTGEAYDIIPGHDDGVASAMPDWPFARGDVWLLRYHPGESTTASPRSVRPTRRTSARGSTASRSGTRTSSSGTPRTSRTTSTRRAPTTATSSARR